jgi:hypothetical protein
LDVDVSGWFLSDDNGDLQRFVIAAGTTILAGQTVVIREDDDANPLTVPPANYFGGAFSFSSTGDEIVLSAGDGQRLLGYTHGFSFGAAENGRSFIRHVDSTGYEYLTAQSGSPGRTLGAENNPYLVGDVVITEVHYNPKGSDPNQPYVDEFIEIQNTTGSEVMLFDPAHPANAWRIDGIDFTFPGNSVLNAGQRALIVPIDPAVFRASYTVDAAVQIFGPYVGSLDNGGERIALQRPDTPDASLVPYIDVDAVRYDDQSPWPTSADGSNGEGHSLTRRSWSDFGSDPASWVGAVPSPGAADTVTVSQVIIAGDDTDPADLPSGPQPVSWQQQRSQLLSLVVEFTEPVVVTAADLQLTNLGRNAPLDPDQPVAITEDQLSIDGRRLTIRFDNAGLEDGVYRLQIADSVHSVAGQALDGDYDGVAGGSFVFQGSDDNRFHVLIGDWNGDAAVTIFDFPVFSYWFGRSVPTSPSYVDLNGDDGVTIFDFGLFAERFGDSVVYPPPGLVTEAVGAIADQLDPEHAGNSAAPLLVRGGAALLPTTFARTTGRAAEPTAVDALDQVLAQWRDPSLSPTAPFAGRRGPRPLSARPSQPSDEVDGPVGADEGFAFGRGLCDDLWSCNFDY